MPEIKIAVAHDLGQEGAACALRSGISELKAKYAGRFTVVRESLVGWAWSGEYQASGLRAAAAVAIGATTVEVSLRLPAPAGLFRGRIEAEVRARLAGYLARATPPARTD